MTSEEGMASGNIDRRRFGLWMAGAAAALAPVGTAAAAAAADAAPSLTPDIQAIRDRGKLVVGMTDFDSAPFYFADSGGRPGASAGWDVELADAVARAIGVDLAIDRRAGSFNAVIDQVAAGTVDIGLSKLSVTPRRAVGVLFSRPTITLRHALLANRVSLARRVDDDEIRTVLNSAFDGSVGVIAASSYAETARQVLPRAVLREYPTWEAVVDAVERGEVDLAYRDELEIKKLMRLKPDLHLSLRSVLITDIRDTIAAAVNGRSVQLRGVVDTIIEERQTLDANQLLDRYDQIFATT